MLHSPDWSLTTDGKPEGRECPEPKETEIGGTGPPAATSAQIAREPNRVKRWFMVLGPGLITGASDDDPSGIATYTVTGASYGFATLWTALITLPMMAAVQFMCAKIGMVTGVGLAGAIRRHYPKTLLYRLDHPEHRGHGRCKVEFSRHEGWVARRVNRNAPEIFQNCELVCLTCFALEDARQRVGALQA